MLTQEEEQQELLCKWGEIPPKSCRRFLSVDGQNLWDCLEFEYEYFYRELEAFFRGEPSQLTELEPKWKHYLRAKREWFLAFYQLLRDAWRHLPEEFKSREDKKLTPGLLASEILEAESKAKLLPAIAGYVEVTPRRNYDLPAKVAKAVHRSDKFVEQVQKDYDRQLGEFYNAAQFEVSIISHCRGAATKDEQVKESLEAFEKQRDKLSAVIYKYWNYRKATQQIWDRGVTKTS